MNYKIEHIIKKLKEARQAKNLSQHELSKKIHVPQSHISKIESGMVDLKTASLIEIARALEMELMLIPRPYITMVKALLRSSTDSKKTRRMYQLDEE